jgi:hypothetical protein
MRRARCYRDGTTLARGSMAEDEYWRMFHLIRGDVEAAIATDNAYITINNLAATDCAASLRSARRTARG